MSDSILPPSNKPVEVSFTDAFNPATRLERWVTFQPVTDEALLENCSDTASAYIGPLVKDNNNDSMYPTANADKVTFKEEGFRFELAAITQVSGGNINPSQQILCINKNLFGHHAYLR